MSAGLNEAGLQAGTGEAARGALAPRSSQGTAQALREAIGTLRQAGHRPQSDDRVAQLLFYLARLESTTNRDSARGLYRQGSDVAAGARERDASDPAATFWWAANEAGIAELDKNIAALGTMAHIERVLLALKQDHADYGFDAIDRLLGNLYAAAPAFISIGSNRKAEACFREAITRFPTFPGNQIVWAKFLQGRGQEREAARVVAAVRASDAYRSGHFADFDWERPFWDADMAGIQAAGQTRP
jgi:hypothetical protein